MSVGNILLLWGVGHRVGDRVEVRDIHSDRPARRPRGRPWRRLEAGVRSRLRVQAVRRAGFAPPRSETFGVVGEPGSGKSLLARIIVELPDADRGKVHLSGADCHLPTLYGDERSQPISQWVLRQPTPAYRHCPRLGRAGCDRRLAISIPSCALRRRRAADLSIPWNAASEFPRCYGSPPPPMQTKGRP